MIRIVSVYPLLLVCLLASPSVAVETYEPVQPSPLMESWRWHPQESLEGMTLTRGVEADDQSVWFVSDKGLVQYDGSHAVHYPAPEAINVLPCRGVAIDGGGRIYLLLPGQIIQFHDGEWNLVYEFQGRYDMLWGHHAVTPDGHVLFGTTEGIVALRDGQVKLISSRNKRVSYLYLDRRQNLWVNEVGSGNVHCYPQFSSIENLLDDNWRTYQLFPDYVAHISFAQIGDNRIWFVNDHPGEGVMEYNLSTDQWQEQLIDPVSDEMIHRLIHLSPDGTTIVYGDKRILLVKGGKVTELTLDQLDFPITSPFLISLSSGDMIIGGRRESTYLVNCTADNWESFDGLNYFCTDTRGAQWFISFEGRLVARDPESGTWLSYGAEDGVINTPLTMISTNDGRVWVAGRHDDVAALSIYHDGNWIRFLHHELGGRVSHQSLIQTRSGSVLLGGGDTEPEYQQGTGGIVKYEVNGNSYTTTHYAPPRVPARIVGIHEDADGTIWTGGPRLYRIDNFQATELPMLGQYSNSWIDDLITTRAGDLWVGQWGLGIHIFDGTSWTTSPEVNPRFTNRIVALHEDAIEPGQVWAATAQGLFNLDRNSWVNASLIKDFSVLREGGKVSQSPDGTLWINSSSRNWNFRSTGAFPGSERFVSSFKTIAFKRYPTAPDTRLLGFEETVYEPGMNHFNWTGLSKWSIPGKDDFSYSYRIDGGEWSEFSMRTEIILESQSNGNHLFEVRSRTPFGQIDPTPAQASFQVIPVLWKQPWFILTILLVLVILVALVVIIVRQRIHHLLALEEYKLQFFTNVSHELRTPLMVILGPLEALSNSVDEKGRRHLNLARRNAHKLVKLVDQLLDFRKASLGKIQTNPQNVELVLFIQQEMDVLKPLVEKKNLTVEFKCTRKSLVVMIDPKIIEVILDNLISNAIKYTPEGGRISVLLDVTEERDGIIEICIQVVDTGPGIPRGELSKVFDLFYQSKRNPELAAKGSGIGLSHARSLVEAVGGSIRAESPVHKGNGNTRGTRFSVNLPVAVGNPEAVHAKQKSEDDDHNDEIERGEAESGNPVMLIVEDDPDIREFLQLEFESNYAVHLAEDGEAGLEAALESIPDVIISDILMPRLDGKELCQRIKTDQRTSHVPVILLTALRSDAHQIAGLETGADDYVNKPINVELLKRRVENLLTNRRNVREFIGKQTRSIVINKDELPVNNLDKEFLTKFLNLIENNLTSETFDVDGLAEMMHMSRMTLYRKVKAVTGQSPGGMIRTIRLKTAAQYLETGSWSVGQVIEKVGFWDLSHFSRAFKKEFGCTPTEYIERFKGEKV